MPKSQPAIFLHSDEEFPMTMQIGMVGTDGVLIASDTRWQNSPRYIVKDSPPRSTFNSQKIRVSHQRGVAISCARNMETARYMANEIISTLKDEDWSYPSGAIEAIGAKVLLSAEEQRNDAQCLITFTRPFPRLFLFQFGMINGKWGPVCNAIETKAIAGDNVNPAIFWAERYYRESPIEKLLPLAAHLIIAASMLNSTAISGLEIVVCNASGLRRLSGESIRELTSAATKWDKDIGELFADYTGTFTFSPKEAG